jgi:hypothetical protein
MAEVLRRMTTRRRHGVGWVAVTLVGGGLLVAACGSSSSSPPTTAPTSTTGRATSTTGAASPASGAASLNKVVSGINKGTGSTFSGTYTTSDTKTGQTQTVTFAQDPPKSAVITSNGSFYIDGQTVTECTGSGSAATCESLSTSLGASLSGIVDLYAPRVLSATIKGLESEALAHAAGVSVTTNSATYGGLASTCATLKNASQATSVTYCVANTSGILTYSSAKGSTVTLTSFTANPPASTFSPPAGSTLETLPAGT